MKKQIIQVGSNYIVRILDDNDIVLIEQTTNPLTGQPITASEEAEEIATTLLSEYSFTNETLLQEKLRELRIKTYQYISQRYTQEKKESDIADENFWPSFLVKKKGYTFEEISNTIYDLTAAILEGKKTFQEIIEQLKVDYPDMHTFGLEPFETIKELDLSNGLLVFDNLGVIYQTSFKGEIDYAGNMLELIDDGQGNILRTDTNEIIGTMDYQKGILTIDDTKLDKNLINRFVIRYRKVFLIPEYKAWEQLLKSAVRITFAQDIKFRFYFLVDKISNMSGYELENLDIDNLIETHYMELPNLDAEGLVS